jgi:hypothetical protein
MDNHHFISYSSADALEAADYALGENQRAITYYEQALALAKTIGDRRNEGVWFSKQKLSHSINRQARLPTEFRTGNHSFEKARVHQ